MSILTLYMANPEQSGSSAGLLTPSTPAASTSTTGWTAALNGIGLYSRMSFRDEKPAVGFNSTAEPSGAPIGLTGGAQDSWRISATTDGTFSAGTWYSSASVIGVTSGGSTPVARVLYSGASLGNASTYTSPGTLSGNTNELLLCTVTTSGTLQSVSSIIGSGVTNWVSVISQTFNTTNKLSVWRAMTAAPLAASRLTVVLSGNASNAQISVIGFSGIDQTGGHGLNAIVSSLTTLGTTSMMTAIMNSVASADNIIVGAFSWASRNAGHTPGVNFTELVDLGSGEAALASQHILWSSSSLTRPASKPVGSLAGAGIAMELKTVFPAGRARFRLWRSANADGTGATEITQGTMVGSVVTGLTTTVAQSSSASTQVAGFAVAGEYLFQQVAWETLTGGVADTNDRLVRFGSMDATSGSGLVTADFAASGGAAAPSGSMMMPYYLNLVQDV